jgi:DNA-binding protein H-NS
MKRDDLDTMSTDELWALREQLGEVLAAKLKSEKHGLEVLLGKLSGGEFGSLQIERQRRPYPKVHPKFQNPSEPSQTWSGRGGTPRWVRKLLAAGRSIDELRIAATA